VSELKLSKYTRNRISVVSSSQEWMGNKVRPHKSQPDARVKMILTLTQVENEACRRDGKYTECRRDGKYAECK
jgi:hypothetical protein